jgi:DNA-binding response OmpR family regulator
MERGTILVVDDEPNIADLVELYLRRDGFRVVKAANGEDGIRAVSDHRPRLVVLDVGLPDIDGLEVCRRLRTNSALPVIFLTARDTEVDRILGLELGADDYVTKPFSPRELTARVKAVLRRANGASSPMSAPALIETDDLRIDVAARQAFRAGELLALTAREFDVLVYLAARPRQAVSRDELLENVWGFTYGDTATVTVHVRRIREKIEANPSEPRHLVTVWSVGYRWEP